jgi:hypothetical protein
MSAVLVDSNIFLDLMVAESEWNPWSAAALEEAADRAKLVINPVIYAEISVGYESMEHLDVFLPPGLEREPVPYEAAFLAGKAYARYRKRSGLKRSPLPDFFIGAHAAVRGYELLTRDARRYRQYFPTLALIAP